MNKLYRYHAYCGRMGTLNGVFAVDDEGEACLRALIESRRAIYFGEVLGKHSEVTVVLEPKDLSVFNATTEEVATVIRVFGLATLDRPFGVISGFCPLDCEGTSEVDDEDLLEWCRGDAAQGSNPPPSA